MKDIPSRLKDRIYLPVGLTNCRIILDCFEINSDKPKKMDQQKATFSSYKYHVTGKNLTGIAPNAIITYMSEQYAGPLLKKRLYNTATLWHH